MIAFSFLRFFPIAGVLLLMAACLDPGEDGDWDHDRSDFIRFVEQDGQGGRLETAVVTYENDAGCRVDLIAAVHLADHDYYSTLQLLFTGYHALLYELVADEEMLKAENAKSDNLVSRFQRGLCSAMNLAFQLDALDYDRANFVHADLTAREFARLWRERGESLWSIVMRVLSAQYKALEAGMGRHLTGPALLEAFRSKDSAAKLKLLLAREFENVEAMLAGLESGKEGEESLLLGERNKAAIRVLEKEMARGLKRLAIFYGAGHMPDLEVRLLRDLGFSKKRQTWLTAWEIALAPEEESQEP